MKAICYTRVSTEEQAKSGLSLTYQREKLVAYCSALDIEVVAVIEDAGKSAKNLKRPGIQKAMEMIRTGQAGALVVLKLDRLTRSVKDLGALVEFFAKTDSSLVAVQDSINTSTAAGRLVLNVLGSVAQWEREAISERVAAAWSVKKARGEKTGGDVPFGFDVDAQGRLVANPIEQEAAELIRELRATGMSFARIAAEVERRGLKTKTGKARWAAMTIQRICTSTVSAAQ